MNFKNGDFVRVHYINIDGCCGDGDIIGDATFISENNGNCRVLMFNGEIGQYQEYLVPSWAVKVNE